MSYDVGLVHGEILRISVNIIEKACNYIIESADKSCYLK